MGRENWEEKGKKQLLIEPFCILTTNLLTLLIPLSFLLLARLSCAQYCLATCPSKSTSSNLVFSVFQYTNQVIVYVVVSTLSVATLVHGLTGKLTVLREWSSSGAVYQPRFYMSFIFLYTLQVCVGLRIEGSISAEIDRSSFVTTRSLFTRLLFFMGLHGTMIFWFRSVVKPVVDDTIFEVARKERWVEKVAMALSIGGLWWWKLRYEVESLVDVAEAKKMLLMEVGVADIVGWWLYYLTVTTGMVRIVMSLLWLGKVLICRTEGSNSLPVNASENGDKV